MIFENLTPYEYFISTLSNGMRVVSRTSSSRVSYIGVAVNAGSRDEGEDRQGLAHFVEHTIFKGTARRSSLQISNRMESIGGELNAYTSKETTVFYTVAPAGDPERAIELLADLLGTASFPDAEIEKEKEVVIEEIHGALDTPAEMVFDEFERLIFPHNDLGHDILGNPESVRRLTSADCRAFVERLYTPGEMVLFVSDPSSPAHIERLAEKHFGSLRRPDTPRRRVAPVYPGAFEEIRDRQGHQSHTLIGAPLFNRYDPRRYALLLYNNYLAGPSMNSRLNQELRERRGLVYAVDSNVSLLSDAGLELIYFGTERGSAAKCRRLILKELTKLAEKTLSDRSFEKIRLQYCGQLLVASDNKESTAMTMGKSLLSFGEVQDAAMTAEAVRAVTPQQFREIAELVAANADHSLTIC